VAAARDEAHKIVQVGYMKRFDPAFVALCDLLRAQTTELKAVNVEVLDPDFWPFVAHRPVVFGDDVPSDLIAESSSRRAEQISAGLGFAPSRDGIKGYAGPLCSSIVHDVNLVSGALAVLNQRIETPIAAALHGADAGVALMARASGDGAPVTMSWHTIPKLAHYSERVSFVFEDAVFELAFPSPYLNHQPTILRETRSTGLALSETTHRPSYAEAFVEELKSFHSAITSNTPVVNTVEQAGADIALLARFGKLALGHDAVASRPPAQSAAMTSVA
jgi:predicted dehydrogenase